MPPVAAEHAAEHAADAAQGGSSGLLKWVEDNKGVIIGATVGVGAAGLGYYLLSNRGKGKGAPPGSPSASGSEKSSSKKKRNKKKSKGARGDSGDALAHPDGPLVQEASDEDIMKLTADEISRLPKDGASLTRRKSLATQLKTAGNEAYKKAKLDKAIEYYTKAIAAEPQSVFYCNRAACYANQQKHREVLDDTQKALELDPKYVKALNRRAVASEKLGGDGGSGKLEDEKVQHLIRAAQDFTAVTLLSKFTDAHSTTMVEQVLERLSHARAAEILRTREPKLPSPTFVTAYLEAFRKRPVAPLPPNPSEGDKLFAEANEALAKKDYETALSLCNRSVEQGLSTDEGKAYALNLRATFKFIMGDAPSAMEDLQESLKLKPDYVQSWVKMASAHMEQANRDEAFADFDRAIALDPNDPDIYYHRGQVRFILQEFEEAMNDYAKSSELDDTFIFSQVQRAVGLYKLGQVSASNEAFTQIMDKFPSSSEAYNYFGELQMDQRKFSDALTNFDRAIAIEAAKTSKDRNVLPMINKALLLFQWKSDLVGAEALCRQALEIDPECDVAVSTLAQLSMQQGKIDECIGWFERSSQIARTLPELVSAITYEYASRSQAAFIRSFPDEGRNLAALAAATS